MTNRRILRLGLAAILSILIVAAVFLAGFFFGKDYQFLLDAHFNQKLSAVGIAKLEYQKYESLKSDFEVLGHRTSEIISGFEGSITETFARRKLVPVEIPGSEIIGVREGSDVIFDLSPQEK